LKGEEEQNTRYNYGNGEEAGALESKGGNQIGNHYGAEGKTEIPAYGENCHSRGLSFAGKKMGSPIPLGMETGYPDPAENNEEQEHLIIRCKPGEGKCDAREENAPREKPALGIAIRKMAESGLNDGRAHIGNEEDEPGLGVGNM